MKAQQLNSRHATHCYPNRSRLWSDDVFGTPELEPDQNWYLSIHGAEYITPSCKTIPIELLTRKEVEMGYQPKGYPRLASLMAKEKEVAIFRRFDHLNLLSLLSLQSEIVNLEAELRVTSRADDGTTQGAQAINASQYAKNFKMLRESGSSQYTILEKIRGKLREYSEYGFFCSDLQIIDAF